MNRLLKILCMTACSLCFISTVYGEPIRNASFLGVHILDAPSKDEVSSALKKFKVGIGRAKELAHGVVRYHSSTLYHANPIFESFLSDSVFVDDQLAFISLRVNKIPEQSVRIRPLMEKTKHNVEAMKWFPVITGYSRLRHKQLFFTAQIASVYNSLVKKYGEPIVTVEGLDLAKRHDALVIEEHNLSKFQQEKPRCSQRLSPWTERDAGIHCYGKAQKAQHRALGKEIFVLKKEYIKETHTWVTDNGQTEIRFIKSARFVSSAPPVVKFVFVNIAKEKLVRDRINGQAEYEKQQYNQAESQLKNVL